MLRAEPYVPACGAPACLPAWPCATRRRTAQLTSHSTAGSSLAVVCFAAEFAGVLFGSTVFSPALNVAYSCVHAIGCLLMLLFLMSVWHYSAFVWIFVLFSAFPGVLEGGKLASALVYRTPLCRLIDIRI